ncbi:MAG TPA: peptidoglycan bridge formation glycyltransferase FemA/FemB family protein [Lapillicoccus sp.]|nr:peptidoglycan bridge formation glycyltransferase FemA/FemB family protein [Lapillicoccus sp.]
MTSAIEVRTVDSAQHLAYVEERSGSFLQTPAWGRLKSDWRSESLGWFAGEEMVGAGLVLYRSLPRIGRSLAYLPEGPVTDWDGPHTLDVLRTLRDHVKAQGAFALRLGPTVAVRRWHAETVKAAMADEAVTTLRDVAPDVTEDAGMRLLALLDRLGFEHLASDDGFAAGQPEFVFQLPLAGRTEEDVLAGMNQLWRRNIKKSAKQGVEVSRGDASDLPAFHAAYVETAARDHFTPRPLAYFERMFDVMTAEDPDRIRLYLAHHGGDLVAATTWVRVGAHTWYSYGASTAAKREVQGSTAIQWRMMQDALAAGASVYDLRGITDTVASDDSHAGLIRFKVGTGGEAVQYVGEWDLPLNRLLYKGFDLYMRRRG